MSRIFERAFEENQLTFTPEDAIYELQRQLQLDVKPEQLVRSEQVNSDGLYAYSLDLQLFEQTATAQGCLEVTELDIFYHPPKRLKLPPKRISSLGQIITYLKQQQQQHSESARWTLKAAGFMFLALLVSAPLAWFGTSALSYQESAGVLLIIPGVCLLMLLLHLVIAPVERRQAKAIAGFLSEDN